MLFRSWIDKQFAALGFLPSSPFIAALAYIRERRAGLEVYLDDPDVAIDTYHLERALRVIPMGRRNGLFSWTELGAKHVGSVVGFANLWGRDGTAFESQDRARDLGFCRISLHRGQPPSRPRYPGQFPAPVRRAVGEIGRASCRERVSPYV